MREGSRLESGWSAITTAGRAVRRPEEEEEEEEEVIYQEEEATATLMGGGAISFGDDFFNNAYSGPQESIQQPAASVAQESPAASVAQESPAAEVAPAAQAAIHPIDIAISDTLVPMRSEEKDEKAFEDFLASTTLDASADFGQAFEEQIDDEGLLAEILGGAAGDESAAHLLDDHLLDDILAVNAEESDPVEHDDRSSSFHDVHDVPL